MAVPDWIPLSASIFDSFLPQSLRMHRRAAQYPDESDAPVFDPDGCLAFGKVSVSVDAGGMTCRCFP